MTLQITKTYRTLKELGYTEEEAKEIVDAALKGLTEYFGKAPTEQKEENLET